MTTVRYDVDTQTAQRLTRAAGNLRMTRAAVAREALKLFLRSVAPPPPRTRTRRRA